MKVIIILTIVLFPFLLNGQARYYKAQMHCHTTNSDGGYTPQALAEKYYNEGYEIIMITDHNYLTAFQEVTVPGMLVIQSEEITFDRHMNAFFISSNIVPDSGYTCQNAIDEVKGQGGLIQLNHYCEGPFTDDNWAVSAPEIISFTDGPDFLEIWNTGTESVQTHDDKSIWDEVLTSGKVVWGSATDDFHPAVLESLEFNKGWNMLWLDSLTPEQVRNALINGNFYASTGVEITSYIITDYGTHKTISIQSSNATKIALWGPGHQLLQEANGSSASFLLQNQPYVRIELTKEGLFGIGNTYAWTQPVFLNPTSTINEITMIPSMNIYPNPTAGLAEVKLQLPFESHIKISVSDLLGKEIKVVCNELLKANDYLFPLLIDHCAEGIYLLKLETDLGGKSMLFHLKSLN